MDSAEFLKKHQLRKHIDNRPHYWKRLQTHMDAQATRAQNLLLRKKFLDKQKAMNYQNEYDRIRGLLGQRMLVGLHSLSVPRLVGAPRHELLKRQDELKDLGAK